jgi:hypothetical protein
MTDDLGDADLTPEQESQVVAALDGLNFLASPESPRGSDETVAQMPPEVWDRMVAALDAQPALATVTPLRPRRRLLPGIAAAAVAVIVVGVGVSVMRPTGSTVADAPAPSVPTPAQTAVAAKAEAAPDAAVQAPPPSTGPMVGAAAPQTRSMIMPTRFLMSSGTDYTSEAIDQQVDGLLEKVGAATPALADAVPTPTAMAPVGEAGFTADLAALRDCITGIMHSSASTALIVDRATFDGGDAGIVIVPQVGEVDVWVVSPNCTAQAPTVLRHVMHAWADKHN